jgi:predicted regulator of amino acid metabolism with ACT domain
LKKGEKMSWLTNLFAKIEGFFNSTKVVNLEHELASLAPFGLQVVQAISLAVPNKTLAEIIKAYELYGIPIISEIADNPTAIGNAMLNLASTILAKQAPGTAVNILNTVISIAVSLFKTK